MYQVICSFRIGPSAPAVLLLGTGEGMGMDGFPSAEHRITERAGLEYLEAFPAFPRHTVSKKGIVLFLHLE